MFGSRHDVINIRRVLINIIAISNKIPPTVLVIKIVERFNGIEFTKSELLRLKTYPNNANETIIGIIYIPTMANNETVLKSKLT